MPRTTRTSNFLLHRVPLLLPLVLALAFGVWSLRGARGGSIADYDSPRHAINGTFLLDLVRHGKIAHPVEYGYWYYSRLPALSLPYHPPLFPAFEGFFFSIFGVSTFSARLAVAIAAAVAFWLMVRLISKSHESLPFALWVTISFFALPFVQRLSSTVMLEVPALAFVVAAVLFLVPDAGTFETRHSLWFGVFGACAIWTKQTVFLLLLPFLYVLISGRWNLLRRVYVWLNALAIAGASACLAMLARQLHWSGLNQSWAKRPPLEQFAHNWHYYLKFGLPAMIVLVACSLTYKLPTGRADLRKDRIYAAWLLAAALVLLASPAYSPRYLFFAIPPFLVLAYSMLHRVGSFFSQRHRRLIPAIACLMFIGSGLLRAPRVFLYGPAEAARILHDTGHRRILFCGAGTNGAFIFAARSYDPSLSTIIVRGDKLPESMFASDQLNDFVRRYGVDAVVFEKVQQPQAWNPQTPGYRSFLSQEQVVPIEDSDGLRNGTLSIYSVRNPSPPGTDVLEIPNPILGRPVELHF